MAYKIELLESGINFAIFDPIFTERFRIQCMPTSSTNIDRQEKMLKNKYTHIIITPQLTLSSRKEIKANTFSMNNN